MMESARLSEIRICLGALTRSGRSTRRNANGSAADGSDAERELAEWIDGGFDRVLLLEAVDSGFKSLYACEDLRDAAADRVTDPASPSGPSLTSIRPLDSISSGRTTPPASSASRAEPSSMSSASVY
jgi:hypothetical protein